MATSLFFIYHQADAQYLSEIENQIQILVNNGAVIYWHQGKLIGGEEWRPLRESKLRESQIVLPIVSANLLASDDCMDLLKGAQGLGKEILPIIASDCLWEYEHILKNKTALPRKDKDTKATPINKWSPAADAYTNVVKGIVAVLPNNQSPLLPTDEIIPETTILSKPDENTTPEPLLPDPKPLPPMPNYKTISFNKAKQLIKQGLPLLVTATDTETKTLHRHLTPLQGETDIWEIYKGNHTYYVGTFGKYVVAHVACDMGAIGAEASLVTVSNAIDALKPKFVLMVGIAFGIDEQKQKIGDVLVSKTLLPYESQRVNNKGNITFRGPQPEASLLLANRFRNMRDWQYEIQPNHFSKLEIGGILTGEKLIDDLDYRDSFKQHFATAIGGEMEGAGLYAACANKSVPWILVKAICDFADGNKKEQKETKQQIAIQAALSACLHLFNKEHIFDDLGVRAVSSEIIAPLVVDNDGKTTMQDKIKNLITLINESNFPELFRQLDQRSIPQQHLFQYNRFKKEYSAGLTGIALSDFAERLSVFVGTLDS